MTWRFRRRSGFTNRWQIMRRRCVGQTVTGPSAPPAAGGTVAAGACPCSNCRNPVGMIAGLPPGLFSGLG